MRRPGKIRRRAEIQGKRSASTVVNINLKEGEGEGNTRPLLNSAARELSECSELSNVRTCDRFVLFFS